MRSWVDDGGARKKMSFGRPRFTIERFNLNAVDLIGDAAPQVAPPAMTRDVLSPDQLDVYRKILGWWAAPTRSPYLTMGGYAGTGKTTLVSVLAAEFEAQNLRVAFGAYTGKAADVLTRKFRAAGVKADCSTLHSLMYEAVIHDHGSSEITCDKGAKCPKIGRVERWQRKPEIAAKLVIVDEASMVGKDLWEDLLSFGVPILAVGDHGQLPPIGRDQVNLMAKPDLRLEKIHRQAEGNPILALAHHVRNGGTLLSFKSPDDRVQFVSKTDDFVTRHLQTDPLEVAVICGYNKTRIYENQRWRARRGFEGRAPDPTDAVICLRNFKPIFNGMRGTFEGALDKYEASEFGAFTGAVTFPDNNMRIVGDFNYHQFGREKTFEIPMDVPGGPKSWVDTGLLFDYGYVLTCHKSQGSQFREVAVLAREAFGKTDDERRRWMYTAITRAAERLFVVL